MGICMGLHREISSRRWGGWLRRLRSRFEISTSIERAPEGHEASRPVPPLFEYVKVAGTTAWDLD